MPRLPTSLLRRAYALDPYLPALLGPCRDLCAAQNELRWLREHVDGVAEKRRARGGTLARAALLRELVGKRARGMPLQYILGTEWFGEVEIRCRKGVLIPRQDTAASISHLVRFLRDAPNLPSELRVLDLCTGTGCIPLLFAHDFYDASSRPDLRILGVDVSEKALELAAHNLERTRKAQASVAKGNISFLQADILLNPFADQTEGPPSLKTALNLKRMPQFWDILISNPPYISPKEYWKTTTRSVRGFEPKLALVPPPDAAGTDTEQGDAFYRPLLTIAQDVEAKIVLLEIADLDQALRVGRRVREMDIYDGIEIWCDQPDAHPNTAAEDPASDSEFPIFGTGNARTVLCHRGQGTQWLQRTPSPHAPTSTPADTTEDCAHISHDGLEPSFDKTLLHAGDGRPFHERTLKSRKEPVDWEHWTGKPANAAAPWYTKEPRLGRR
ncbi:S-adenosyl-L-methionine-dependent methyltransferase [Lentithecium fluviatile CBS 122367]|uniref:S-adenosyl-L-methionine-dependent methyltransferase n=1 Tax=Lentithecium fluviatile CBS 122367 TaxID=1168545 RepID=A0A6G1JE57_9PLEO|nr:S-adenosyl-L-methionine-dependent methyltransferase [Lentithecium fluviatile CBS 122367]